MDLKCIQSKGHTLCDSTDETENRPVVAGVGREEEKTTKGPQGDDKMWEVTALHLDYGGDHMTKYICLNSENNLPQRVNSTLFKF